MSRKESNPRESPVVPMRPTNSYRREMLRSAWQAWAECPWLELVTGPLQQLGNTWKGCGGGPVPQGNSGTITMPWGMDAGQTGMQSPIITLFSWTVKGGEHLQGPLPIPEFPPKERCPAGGMAVLWHHSVPNTVNLYFPSTQQSTWRSRTPHRGWEP